MATRQQAIERLVSDWHHAATKESREGRQDGLAWAEHDATIEELRALDSSIDDLIPLTCSGVALAARPGCDPDDFWFVASSPDNFDEIRHSPAYLFAFVESATAFWRDVQADVEAQIAAMQLV